MNAEVQNRKSGRRIVGAAVLVATLGFGSAFAVYNAVPGHNPSDRRYIDGDNALPWMTLTDWVSYSDAVVAVEVIGEKATSLTAEEAAAGAGLKIRLVSARVQSILWKSPNAHAVPVTLTIPHGGWSVSNNRAEQRLYLEDAPDLQIGHTYLMPLTYSPKGDVPWQALAPEDILPMDGGTVGSGESILNSAGKPIDWLTDRTEVRGKLWHKSSKQVTAALAATPVDQYAGSHQSLPAVERFHAGLAAKALRPEARK